MPTTNNLVSNIHALAQKCGQTDKALANGIASVNNVANAAATAAAASVQDVTVSGNKLTVTKGIGESASSDEYTLQQGQNYAVMTGATDQAAGASGLVPAPAAGDENKFLRGDGTFATPPDTNTTYSEATTSAAGLMSAADKTKLDGLDDSAVVHVTGAETVAGVKTFSSSPVVPDATANGEAVNKGQMDNAISGISIPTLSDAVNSNSSDTAASSKAVKTAYDAAASAQSAANTAQANATTAASAAQEASSTAAAAQAAVSAISVGSSSQVFGICRYATGGGSGTWFHVDEDEKSVISLNEAYFNHHSIYGNILRSLVDGQVMNRMPKLWIKHVTPTEGVLAGKPVTMISPAQREGYKVHPAFMNNGEEIPYFYLGCYKAGNLDNKAVSLPGYAPLVSINFTTMQARCTARNVSGVEGFMMQDVYQRSLIKLLFLAEYANPDSQNILGNGHVSGSAAVTVDNVANHTPWRNFHGLWGNVWEMVDGIRANGSKQAEIFRNDGTRSYVNTGLAMTVYGSGWTGWIVEMMDAADNGYDMRDVYVPKTANGTQTNGSYGDNHYGAVANGVCYDGGHWGHGTSAGLFCTDFAHVASNSSTGVGSRLAKV